MKIFKVYNVYCVLILITLLQGCSGLTWQKVIIQTHNEVLFDKYVHLIKKTENLNKDKAEKYAKNNIKAYLLDSGVKDSDEDSKVVNNGRKWLQEQVNLLELKNKNIDDEYKTQLAIINNERKSENKIDSNKSMTTTYRELPIKPGSYSIKNIVKNKEMFLIDNKGERVRVSGRHLESSYSNSLNAVIAFVGYTKVINSDNQKTLAESAFGTTENLISNISGSMDKMHKMLLAQGGIACILKDKTNQKYSLKADKAEKYKIIGDVERLGNQWVVLDNCIIE